MPRNDAVEKYKIDSELLKRSKQYKMLTKASKELKKKIVLKHTELQKMARMLYGTDQIRDQVLNMMNPQEKVLDQPEINTDLQIRY